MSDILENSTTSRREYLLESIYRYSSDHPVISAGIAPAILSGIGILILSVKPQGGAILYFALFIYVLVAVIKFVVDYSSAKHFTRILDRSYSLESQINHLDKIVETKYNSMLEAVESSTNPKELLRRSRGKLQFDRSAKVINNECAKTIIEFLRSIGRGQDAEFSCQIFSKDDESGDFLIAVPPYQLGGTKVPTRETKLNISMDDCLVSRVWKNEAMSIESISDTHQAAEEGRFTFSSESEKNNLKSVCCYQIFDQYLGETSGVWCIDADEFGVFPNHGDPIEKEIANIFKSFSSRFSLERIYSYVLDNTESLYIDALANNGEEQQHEKQED